MTPILANYILSLGVSFLVTVVIGKFMIPRLQRMKLGQSIRSDGPVWHMSKQGTPTMGGLMFIGGIAAACLTVGFSTMRKGEFGHIFILIFAIIFAAIGFLDDFEKLRKKQNLGLTAIQKLALQLVVAITFVLLLRNMGYLSTDLYIPFANITVSIPEAVYLILAAFIVVATVNAVNITDGVDGLVTGVSIPVALCYSAIAFAWTYAGSAAEGDASIEAVGLFAAALTGGLLGFLVFNFHPAKIFMGDTGSLFLGGAICALAFALDMPLILVPLGIVYIVETLSDIIQIVYFKLSHGKRIFRMAPLHHHLEMKGWNEYKLFAVFTGISTVFAVISYFAVAGRYGI